MMDRGTADSASGRPLFEALERRILLDGGEIHGAVWEDADGDGVRETGEQGMPNVVVYLDLNANETRDDGEPSTFTGPSGEYAFGGVAPGEYTVAEAPSAEYRQTFPLTPSGQLSFLQILRDGTNGGGLVHPTSIAISPDGAHVYTTSVASDDTVTIFHRDL